CGAGSPPDRAATATTRPAARAATSAVTVTTRARADTTAERIREEGKATRRLQVSRRSDWRPTVAIFVKVMPTYREILAPARTETDEVTSIDVPERVSAGDPPFLLDVRELDEWQEGHLPGAYHIPRGNLESRIEALVPDKGLEIVIYCASGARSVFAA